MTSLWVIYRTVNFPYFYSRNYSLWLIRGTVWIQIYHKPLWAYSFENQGPYTLADRGLFAKRSLTYSSRSVHFQPGPYTLRRTDINDKSQLLPQWRNYSKPMTWYQNDMVFYEEIIWNVITLNSIKPTITPVKIRAVSLIF